MIKITASVRVGSSAFSGCLSPPLPTRAWPIIDKKGKVVSIMPLMGYPLCLTEEAIYAVQRWTI